MKSPNRDLLVLLKDEYMSEQSIEQEVELLNEMLFHVESMDNFCKAHGVFDLNRYKSYTKSEQIIQVVRQREIRPFQFVCNKN